MVLEVGVEPRLAVLVGAQQVAVAVAHLGEDELGAGARRLEVVGAAEDGAGLGQGGDRQRVPGGEPLVVEPRPDALRPRLVQRPAGRGEARGLGRVGAVRAGGAGGEVEDVGALEVAALADAVVGDHLLGARQRLAAGIGRRQDLADRGRRPDVEAPLDPLRVGVERRVEAALGPAHLAQHPVERLLAGAPVAPVAEPLPAVQVGAGEQRVVVEHLLEVGDEPDRVDRVAGEAAAELVVDAAGEHRVERRLAPARSRRGSAAAPAPRRAGTWGRRRSRRAARSPAASSALTASSISAAVGSAGSGSTAPTAPSRRRTSPARSRISSRRVSKASTTASITIRKLGMPRLWSGGK